MLAVPVSAIFGSPLAGWLMSIDNPLGWPGWQWMLLVEGTPTLLLAVASLWLLPDHPRNASWLSTDEGRWLEGEIARESERHPEKSPGLPLGNYRLWIAGACWFGLLAGANGLLYWLPQIIRHLSAESSDVRIGFITALPWIAVAIGMLVNAWHSDRVGERHVHAGRAGVGDLR